MTFARATALAAALMATAAPAEQVGVDAVPLDADIVVMGETHDVPQHHANQAVWVGRLAPAAVVFEMIPPELGETATRLSDAPMADLEAALGWTARGWTDFEAYHPIFQASGDARIYGAEVSRDDLGTAIEGGATMLLGGDAATFGLDMPLDAAEQATREAEQDEAHCNALPAEMLGGMVEAQRLRDAALARAALSALDETGGPVAVITGNGHARVDRGVARSLDHARPDLDVISVGQLLEPQEDAPFDVWVVSGELPPDAGDPCAAFR